MADPKPRKIVAILHGNGPVMETDAGRPKASHLLEMEGRMAGIALKQFVILIRELANFRG